MSADADDLLTGALLPGERIVWADRPHGVEAHLRVMLLFWCEPRRALWLGTAFIASVVVGAWVVFLLIGFTLAYSHRGGPPISREDTIGFSFALGGCFLTVAGTTVGLALRLMRAAATRYAVTDAARALVFDGKEVRRYEIPTPGSNPPNGPRDLERGDIDLGVLNRLAVSGNDRVVFHGVAHPLIAIDTIRAASLSGKKEETRAR